MRQKDRQPEMEVDVRARTWREQPCPQCGTVQSPHVADHEYDPTHLYLKGSKRGGNFCGTECILGYLRKLVPEDIDWLPYHRVQHAWGGPCACGCLWGVRDIHPETPYMYVDGWYGSQIADPFSIFRTLECAIRYCAGIVAENEANKTGDLGAALLRQHELDRERTRWLRDEFRRRDLAEGDAMWARSDEE